MFYLGSNDGSLEIPCNIFEEMKNTQVVGFNWTLYSINTFISSVLNKSSNTCLDRCELGDIALVGQLRNLEVLSFFRSQFKQVPKEIGQLTRLKLLKFTSCSALVLISPNVISSLKRLEALRMGIYSFNQWETEAVIGSETKCNASLSELKHLSRLTALDIHILDANILPRFHQTCSLS
jgi:hypothetical protein